MLLNFPNDSRSYNVRRNRVVFWGHDRAMEVSFFVEGAALCKLSPRELTEEKDFLEVFDEARERIHAVARKLFARARKDTYTLTASDF